jgi:hypothetical protein
LAEHRALLDGISPDGTALDTWRGWFKPGNADGHNYKNNQGHSPNQYLFAAFLLFKLWACYVHRLKKGNPNAKSEYLYKL